MEEQLKAVAEAARDYLENPSDDAKLRLRIRLMKLDQLESNGRRFTTYE